MNRACCGSQPVADPRSGARLCETQRFMAPPHVHSLEVFSLHARWGETPSSPNFYPLEIRAESRPTVHDDLCKFKPANAPRRWPGVRIAGANCRVALKHATGVLAAPARE